MLTWQHRRDEVAAVWDKKSLQIRMLKSPLLEPLHDDPRWEAVLEEFDSERECPNPAPSCRMNENRGSRIL